MMARTRMLKLLAVHCVGISQIHLNLCQQAITFSLNFQLIAIQLTEDLESNMMSLVSLILKNNTVYNVYIPRLACPQLQIWSRLGNCLWDLHILCLIADTKGAARCQGTVQLSYHQFLFQTCNVLYCIVCFPLGIWISKGEEVLN